MIPKSKKVFVAERKIDGQFCRLEISRQYDQCEKKYYNAAFHVGPTKRMVREKPSYLSAATRGKSMRPTFGFGLPLFRLFIKDIMKPGEKLCIHFASLKVKQVESHYFVKHLNFEDTFNYLRYVKQKRS